MDYQFSWGSFTLGILILIIGATMIIFYRPLADHMGNGVSSYDRFRLYGIIGCILGLVVMLNIHTALLTSLVKSLLKI